MGQAKLDSLSHNPISEDNHLKLAQQLRQDFSTEETHALLETALLRQRAADKFSRAPEMYFTRAALEQASSEIVSRYRAGRLERAGIQTIADLGCSIGGDSLAMSSHARVFGIDRSLTRLVMARENIRTYGNSRRFTPICADLIELPAFPVDAFFADPARRDAQGRRLFSPADYIPPLPRLLDRWLPAVPHAAVKISPGIDYNDIPPQAGIEFISLDGEVKEGLLWFGDLRDGAQRRAMLLPQGATLTATEDDGDPVPITLPRSFLFEPDGAVIRAHLVEQLARRMDVTMIDPTIAYLTGDTPINTPFARCFAVEESMPFHLKKLRARLRQLNVGRVIVKKRGSPLTPEALQQRLNLEGEREVIVFLTRVRSEPYILIAQEVKPQ